MRHDMTDADENERPPGPPGSGTIGDKERAARAVVRELRARGHVAYFAGGCVRDHVRGEPPADFDVATDASADRVQSLFARTVPVGAQFGVVLVVIKGQPIEVATFRADAEYLDGRHPVSVRAAAPEEDARRRDFTINGMFLDPETGEVLDFVGGRADIEARLVRAIGDPDQRFHEDRLRLLRAVRLAARLGYAIEPRTFAAVRRRASGDRRHRLGENRRRDRPHPHGRQPLAAASSCSTSPGCWRRSCPRSRR